MEGTRAPIQGVRAGDLDAIGHVGAPAHHERACVRLLPALDAVHAPHMRRLPLQHACVAGASVI